MKIRDLLLYTAAVLIGLFGLLMTLGATMSLGQDEERTTNVVLGIGLGLLPIAFSIWLVSYVRRSSTRRRREELERHVLHLAVHSGGELTPGEVAKATSLTLEESKAFLDKLHLDGHCQMDLAEDGRLTYNFQS